MTKATGRLGRSTVVAVVALVGHLGTAGSASAQAAPAASDRFFVMPFENPSREPRAYWLSEASSVLLTDELTALGASVIPRDQRLKAFEQLQVPPIASLSYATVIRIGQLVGAAQVAIGSLTLAGDQIDVRVRNVRLDTGRMQTEVAESGPIEDLFGLFERLARQLVPSSAMATGARATVHPSLSVFENYIKGLLAESPSSQVSYLQAALKLDPAFDRAHLALWSVYQEEGSADRALAAAAAVREGSPWYRQARFDSALSQLELKRYDEAYATLKALADQSPTAAVLNDLGIVQLRRGSTPQSGRATYYFNQAAKSDPDDPDYYFNLGYAYWLDRDLQATIYWLREAVRRNPADGDAHAVLGVALQAAGTATEAAREKELARQLSSRYAEWERRPAAGEPVPRGLERLKTDLDVTHVQQIDNAMVISEQKEQRELAAFHLDRGRRFFEQESDREAETELRRSLYLSPYQAGAHLLLGRIHLRTGRIADAIDAFTISLWSEETLAAHLALADAYLRANNGDAARGEAQRAAAMAPDSPDVKALLERIGAPRP